MGYGSYAIPLLAKRVRKIINRGIHERFEIARICRLALSLLVYYIVMKGERKERRKSTRLSSKFTGSIE